MLTTDPKARKGLPICSGVLDYFPDALAAVAACSKAGNEQHNPGQPLHWDRTKSLDHADCIARHLMERGTVDVDGIRHAAKLAWRALALLQTEIEAANQAAPEPPGPIPNLAERPFSAKIEPEPLPLIKPIIAPAGPPDDELE